MTYAAALLLLPRLFIFRFALKNNLPLLNYVTLPRTGALEAILNVLGPHAGSVDLSLVDDLAGQGLYIC